MRKRLFIGNLSYQASELDVRDLLDEVGEVASVKLILDRETGRSRGFAFAEMANDDAADEAIKTLNGREVFGRAITVREAEDRPRAPRGPGGPGGSPGFGRGGGGGGDRDRDRGGRRNRW